MSTFQHYVYIHDNEKSSEDQRVGLKAMDVYQSIPMFDFGATVLPHLYLVVLPIYKVDVDMNVRT